MPFAKLNKENIIEEIRTDPGSGLIELSDLDMKSINESDFGHAEFRYCEGNFVADKSLHNKFKCGVYVVNGDKSQFHSEAFYPILQDLGNPHEVGSFGNIWVNKLYFPTKDTIYEGHTHDHDHVSLLMSGRVLVEVNGHQSKEFVAPTYITIKATHRHKITALEDNTLWWCLHAKRDEDGDVIEVYGEHNSPYL